MGTGGERGPAVGGASGVGVVRKAASLLVGGSGHRRCKETAGGS